MLYFTLIRYSRYWDFYQVSWCNEPTGSRFRLVNFKLALRKFYGSRNDFASCYRIFVSQITKDICSCCRDNTVIISSSITDCLLFATRVTGREQNVEKELSTLPKHKNVTSRHNIAKDWSIGVRQQSIIHFSKNTQLKVYLTLFSYVL